MSIRCSLLAVVTLAFSPIASAQPADAPPRLRVGTSGFFQPGLLLQGWFTVEHAAQTTSTFRIRRAELSVKGEIVPGCVAYALMLDPAKVLEMQDAVLTVANQEPAPADPDAPETVTARQPVSATSAFQDFFVTALTPWVDISVGQFKIPVSWEGVGSSSRLLFPERALVSREFGDKRDLGLRFARTFPHFGFSAGVWNGASLNNLDSNNDKDFGLRLEAYPIEGLVVAGVLYRTIGERSTGLKDRYEADLRFERGPFLLQAEYIRARDAAGDGAAVDAQGFYAAVAWTLFGILQPCLRVGALDPDVDRDLDPEASHNRDEVWHFDAALNYFVRQHEAKLQVSYSRLAYDDRTVVDQIIAAAQVAF